MHRASLPSTFLGVSFAAFICMLAISQQVFYKAAIAGMESTAPQKRLTRKEISKASDTTRAIPWRFFLKNGNFSGERHFS